MLNIGTHPVFAEIALYVASGSNGQVNPAHAIVGFIVKAGVLIYYIGYFYNTVQRNNTSLPFSQNNLLSLMPVE